MKILSKGKDGGPKSNVTGYWLIEWKRFFSIALLRFDHGSREEFHSHAFNCASVVLRGSLREEHLNGDVETHESGDGIITKRDTFHRVYSEGTSWVFTVRGPWDKTWKEFDPNTKKSVILGDGRKVVDGAL